MIRSTLKTGSATAEGRIDFFDASESTRHVETVWCHVAPQSHHGTKIVFENDVSKGG